MNRNEQLIIVRGGGDIATGSIYKLHRAGYPVIVLETAYPSAIRRHVAVSEAVFDGSCEVEDLTAVRVSGYEEALELIREGAVPVLVDETCDILKKVRPWALVDGILAKKNMGTTRQMADKTIGLGPGFTAGKDVDLVVETKRGHNLGRVIANGTAAANTGIPGLIDGYGKERVMHCPATGIFLGRSKIGDQVQKDDTIAVVVTGQGEVPVKASLTGLLRGIIKDGYPVEKGLKVADIDPRQLELDNCYTISDKARCIAGGVLEGLLYLEAKQGY